MEETPCVLSIGQLCLRDVFSFAWGEGESPVLQHKQSGLHITCQHSHNVPLITPVGTFQLELPNMDAGGDSLPVPEGPQEEGSPPPAGGDASPEPAK